MIGKRILPALLCAVLTGGFLALPSRVAAAVAVFGLNAYEYVEFGAIYNGSNNSWFDARDAAAASTYNSVNGHLATITSQAENDFLQNLAVTVTQRYGWIGGAAPSGWLLGPESGQAFSYSNFGGSEPNNNGYAYLLVGPNTFAGVLPGQWADDSFTQGFPDASDPVNGYFIEYELAAIPESSTAAAVLGTIGLAFTLLRSRRPGFFR